MSTNDNDDFEIPKYSRATFVANLEELLVLLDYDQDRFIREFMDLLILSEKKKKVFDRNLFRNIFDMVNKYHINEVNSTDLMDEFYYNFWHYVYKRKNTDKPQKKQKKIYSKILERKYSRVHKISEKDKKLTECFKFLKEEFGYILSLVKSGNLYGVFDFGEEPTVEIRKIYTYLSNGFHLITHLLS